MRLIRSEKGDGGGVVKRVFAVRMELNVRLVALAFHKLGSFAFCLDDTCWTRNHSLNTAAGLGLDGQLGCRHCCVVVFTIE